MPISPTLSPNKKETAHEGHHALLERVRRHAKMHNAPRKTMNRSPGSDSPPEGWADGPGIRFLAQVFAIGLSLISAPHLDHGQVG